jgi:serine protease Do
MRHRSPLAPRLRCPLGSVAVLAAAWAACAAAAGPAGDEPTLAEERAIRAAVDRVAAAVVRIEPVAAATVPPGAEAGAAGTAASGVVIDPAGLIVTTAAVAPEGAAAAIVVLPDGRRIGAQVRGRDEPRGIVLLATDPVPDAPSLEAVPRAALAPGQWTIAVGRGWSHATPAVSVGVLSAVERCWGRGVQTDAAVSPANYGGPLVDIRGRVIGILVPVPAEAADAVGGLDLYDSGIGFAVPLVDVLAVRDRLERGDTLAAGILGISYRSRDPLTGSPVIGGCRQGSPAAAAGLRPGDRIVAVDGRPTPRIADVRQRIAPRYAGDTVTVAVERPGSDAPLERRVTLAATLPPWRRAILGITAASGTGVTVAHELPGGPADRAGIARGDRIEAAAAGTGDPVPLDDATALASLLHGLAPGDAIRLDVARAADRRTVTVTTAAAPGDPPPAEPASADGAEAPVVPLAAADGPRRPLVVLPDGAQPVGVLVFLGDPGDVRADRGEIWRRAAARHGVAVVLPVAGEPRGWSRTDLPGIRAAVAALATRRPIDPGRIAVAGRGADGFAWTAADGLGVVVRGVALGATGLPRRAVVVAAEPGRDRWVLLPPVAEGPAARGLAADRDRLQAAGHPVGTLPAADPAALAESLCGWTALLDLL